MPSKLPQMTLNLSFSPPPPKRKIREEDQVELSMTQSLPKKQKTQKFQEERNGNGRGRQENHFSWAGETSASRRGSLSPEQDNKMVGEWGKTSECEELTSRRDRDNWRNQIREALRDELKMLTLSASSTASSECSFPSQFPSPIYSYPSSSQTRNNSHRLSFPPPSDAQATSAEIRLLDHQLDQQNDRYIRSLFVGSLEDKFF
jgi:hypothetical protein